MKCGMSSFYTSLKFSGRAADDAALNFPIDKNYEIRNRLSVIMDIQIIRHTITRYALQQMSMQQFGDMVKAVVDVE